VLKIEGYVDDNSLHSILLGKSKILSIVVKIVFTWVVFPSQLRFNIIQTLTHMAPFSVLVNVVDIATMLIVMVEDVFLHLKNIPNLEVFVGFSVISYGVGSGNPYL
jgi:hypothetical protein